MVLVPESQEDSQRYADYGLEATQLSQPVNTQASHYNSQVEPRRAYCESSGAIETLMIRGYTDSNKRST